ncbi:MAG: hypothetical protein AAF226_06900, partial [Verrucomicrobiota bacterium]
VARPDDEKFQISRVPTASWKRGDNFYLKIGETSDDQQFRLDKYEEKEARSPTGIMVDASVLYITYLPNGKEYLLVRRIEQTIPTYFATLDFTIDNQPEFNVKEGDSFSIAMDPKTKYRLVKVTEDSSTVTATSEDGKENTIEIRKK